MPAESKSKTKSPSAEIINKKIEHTWFRFFTILLKLAIDQHPKSIKLRLISAKIQKVYLNNHFKSIFEYMICEETKPNFQDQFFIYRDKIEIEKIMQSKHDSHTATQRKLNVIQLEEYEHQYLIFENLILSSTIYCIKFWKELLKERTDVNDLY